MADDSAVEPFPAIRSASDVVDGAASLHSAANGDSAVRRRRKSSNLPEDPRGDTGGSAIATFDDRSARHAASTSSQTPSKAVAERGRKRRKAKSLLRRWKTISLRHTWINPLIIVLVILAIYYAKPGPQNPVYPAIFLSYPLPRAPYDPYKPSTPLTGPMLYGKGGLDFAFVGFYTIVFSFTREFLMQRLIRPIAIHCGIKSRAKQARFMEQFYTAIYFGIMGPAGLYVMRYHSPLWYFNTEAMYESFPNRAHEPEFKAYYLLQAGYWAQQAIVLLLQLEKPRKDFKELVAHHIITLTLIWLSYRFHFAFMGLPVYVTHDVSDFFLATSKIFNYLDSPIVGPYFALFIFVWAYCRHYLNLRILWSVLTTFQTVGPFEVNWVTQQYKCRLSQYITFGLLAALQSVNLFWFFLILRIAKNYVLHNKAEDERSEYGSDDEIDESVETTAEKRARMAREKHKLEQQQQQQQASPSILVNGSPPDETIASAVKTRSAERRRKA